MPKRVVRRAAVSAAALLLIVSAVAYADVINADGDRVLPSAQTLIHLGTVGAGATVTYNVYFLLECRNTTHAAPGSTITLTPRNPSFPPGGSISGTAATIGPVPSTWPAPGQTCVGDPVFQSTTASVVTIVAPMVADTGYVYRLEYAKAPTTGLTGISTMTFRLDVSANNAPVVTVPVDQTIEADVLGGWVSIFDATATDVEDGPLAAPCVPGPGSLLPVGPTMVICTATDSLGATGSASFRVTVTDTTAPALSGVPASLAVDTPEPAGTIVGWPDPSAFDLVEGPVAVTCAPASGSMFAIGSTSVECSASDSRGNVATSAFNVNLTLVDSTPPVLSGVPGDITTDTAAPSGADVSWTAPTANDNVDGPIPVTCAPASGSRFPVGSTTVRCSATDAHDNTATSSFNVDVNLVDTTRPVLSGIPGNIAVDTGSPVGAVVTWPAPSANDNLDGPVPVTCDPASGDRFPVGTTTVDCSATDAHGNTATASFTVRVTLVDTTPPTLTGVPADIAVQENAAGRMAVTWPDPSAVDNIDGPVPVTCTPASGWAFPVGTTSVTCSATDSAGNVASGRFNVTVTAATPDPDPDPDPDPEPAPELSVDWSKPIGDADVVKAKLGKKVSLSAKIMIDGAKLRPSDGTPTLVLERLTECGGEVVERIDGGAFRFKEKAWKLNLDTSRLGAGCWRVSVAVGEYEGGAFELMLRDRNAKKTNVDAKRDARATEGRKTVELDD